MDLPTARKITISAIAGVSTVVFLAYCFQTTRPLAVLWLGDPSITQTRFADILPLIFYVGLGLVLTASIEDVIKALKIGSGAPESTLLITQTLASVLSVIFGIFVMIKGRFDLQTLWDGYPGLHMPFVVKAFYQTQLAFLIQFFVQAGFLELFTTDFASPLKDAGFLSALVVTAYVLKLAPLGVVLITYRYATQLASQLTESYLQQPHQKWAVRALNAVELLLNAIACTFVLAYGNHGVAFRIGSSIGVMALVCTGCAVRSGKKITRTGGGEGTTAPRPVTRTPAATARRGSGDRRSRRNARRGGR